MEITTEPIGPELPSRQTKRDASGARPPHMLGEALDNTKHDDANHVDSKTVRDSACRSATWVQGAFLAALIVMPVGCAPSLDTVTITQGPDVNVIQVEARIRGAAAVNLGTPTLGIALVSGAQTP